MNCENCQEFISDPNLAFCTNCGARLDKTWEKIPPELTSEFATAKTAKTNDSPKPPASNLKWVALIVALIAIPASIFGVYLLMKSDNNQQISQNTNKPKTPAPTATRKANTNQNPNANLSNANTANTNINANTNSSKPKDKNEIMNERIEIAPKEHYAVPFKVEGDIAEIVGKARVLQGEKFDGYVYSQEMFDNHFPDPNYKIFSFGGEKNVDVDQTLVETDYVLVFINKSDKPIVIQAKFSLKQ